MFQFESLTKSSILYLNIKWRYLKDILSGAKRHEYRDKTHYYWSRIGKKLDCIRYIWFMNGMNRNAKEMLIEFKGIAVEDPRSHNEYVLKLGEIISTDKIELQKLRYL